MSFINTYSPRSPGRRFLTNLRQKDLSKAAPLSSLSTGKNAKAGRNSRGVITVRRRGGGVKRKYRRLQEGVHSHWIHKTPPKDDERQQKSTAGISEAKVLRVEYDPNRTANIALLAFTTGHKKYCLCPRSLRRGQKVYSGLSAPRGIGTTRPLHYLPLGCIVHNVELRPGSGGQLTRASGTFSQLLAKDKSYATITLPSGEVRLIRRNCNATIGQVSNPQKKNTVYGKAGASRRRGKRPKVRGSAMNPVDHPHGGGEGRCSVGRKAPVNPWGKPALGPRTRNPNAKSNSYIVRRRRE